MRKHNNLLRAASLLMIVAMMISALAACGKNGKEAAQETKTVEDNPLIADYPEFATHHELKITWFEQGWTGPVDGQDLIAPVIEEKTNLLLGYEPMTVPTSDDYTQQLNLTIAGGEIPEAFFGGIDSYTREIYTKLGESGKIWDLTGMITQEEYPNLYALIYPEMELYQSAKGQMWFLPTQTGRGYENLNEPPHGITVSLANLEALDMDYPETTDEYYEYVSRCVNELGTKGILFGENLAGVSNIADSFYPLIGSHDSYGLPFDAKNDYAVCNYRYTDSDELMAAAKFINKLSVEGLMDSEVLTIKSTQFTEKGASGDYASVIASWWDYDSFNDAIGATTYVVPPILYSNDSVKSSREIAWTDWVGCWSSLIINKSVSEDTVKHLLSAMEWLCTTEGQLLVNAGIEGETYEWISEDRYAYTADFQEKTNGLDWNTAAGYGVFYYAQLVQNAPAIAEYQDTPSALLREDNQISWNNRAEERARYDKYMTPTYDYYFVKGEKENELMPAIEDAELEFWAKVITASSEAEVEALVHEWGETTKKLGIDDIIAERTAAMDVIKSQMD